MTRARLAIGRMRFDGDRPLHQLLDAGERRRVGGRRALVVAKKKSHDAEQIVLHEQSLDALRCVLRDFFCGCRASCHTCTSIVARENELRWGGVENGYCSPWSGDR